MNWNNNMRQKQQKLVYSANMVKCFMAVIYMLPLRVEILLCRPFGTFV